VRVLDRDDLREKGIKHCRQHLDRLVKDGKFPAPIKIGENRVAWVENEVDAYIRSRIAARDDGVAADTAADKAQRARAANLASQKVRKVGAFKQANAAAASAEST
jgi:prophage regulatory protein